MDPPVGAPEPTGDPEPARGVADRPGDDDPAEDWGPADEWPVGPWDDGRWEFGPECDVAPESRPVGLALGDCLRAIAASYRAVPSDLGALLAETIEDLLVEVEVTGARTVDQLRDRRAGYLEPA